MTTVTFFFFFPQKILLPYCLKKNIKLGVKSDIFVNLNEKMCIGFVMYYKLSQT